jgi:tetratricopeptide (TPR) repeat protein
VDRAERAAAHEEAAAFLRMALELLPEADPREPRILARLGLALAWSMSLEEAVGIASEAGDRIAASEGDAAAADYLADACHAVWGASFNPLAWRLAQQGLRYVGRRRDFTWFRLCGADLTRREAEDPDAPGIQLDAPERRELAEVLERHPEVQETMGRSYMMIVGSVSSREELRTRFASAKTWRAFSAGEYRQFRQIFADDADAALAKGQLALAAISYTMAARLEGALGNLEASERNYTLAREVAERLPPLPFLAQQMSVVPMEHYLVRRESPPEAFLPLVERFLKEGALENRWVVGVWRAIAASLSAEAGREAEAMRWLELALPAIERGPGWAVNYPALVCLAANALWVLERCDHIEAIERNLREKVIGPDFRYPHFDGRLALATLLALRGRLDEAREWFEKARRVLDEEGQRPLRAVVDFEEARAHVRRNAPGDRERAGALLDAALERFETLGMTGWVRRAQSLKEQL